jgi:hypothetical protein
VLAIVFALAMPVVLATLSTGVAVYLFACFALVDGVLAVIAGRRADNLDGMRSTCLVAEGVIAIVLGLVLCLVSRSLMLVSIGIAVNGIIGGALGCLYSFGEATFGGASLWALYGLAGIILGFTEPAIMVFGMTTVLIALSVGVGLQGVARLFLRNDVAVNS